MPLYEYKCGDCGFRFEELIYHTENTEVVACRKCKGQAQKVVSPFAHTVKGGSINETVDMTVGREASKRWQRYSDTQSKRRGDKELQSFPLPKDQNGKYMPVMGLGDKKEVETRKEYVSALQDHNRELKAKGIPQFTEQGAF